MDDELIDEIERKSIKHIPKFVWAFFGVCVVITAFLLANGIHLGTIVNRHIDIVQKERELGIESKVENQKDIEMLYTLIAKNNKEINQLKNDNQILKENSHSPAN